MKTVSPRRTSSFDMQPFRSCRVAGLTVALVAILAGTARATTYYWDTTTTGLWGDGANWSNNSASGGTTGTVPLSTDSGVFNQSSVNGAETVQLSGATSVTGMTFNNTGTTLLESSSNTSNALTIGTGGITLGASAGAVTLGDATNLMPIIVGGNQTWNNGGRSLMIANAVTSSSGNTLAFSGAGTTTLNGSSSNFNSGPITINAGTVNFNGSYSGTAGALTMAGGTLGGSGTLTTASANFTGASTVAGNLNATGGVNNTGSGTVTFTGGVAIDSSGSTFWNPANALFLVNGGTTTIGSSSGNGNGTYVLLASFHRTQTWVVQQGTLNMLSNSPSIYTLFFGSGDGNALDKGGALYQTGGTVNIGGTVYSHDSNNNPRAGLALSGGTATFLNIADNMFLDVSGTNSTTITGTLHGVLQGVSVSGSGQLSVASYNNTNTSGPGTFLSGGTLTVNNGTGQLVDNDTSSGGVFLSGGGTLSVNSIAASNVVALNGVTIKTGGTPAANLIAASNGIKIYMGGVTIDTTNGNATESSVLAGTTGYGLTGTTVSSGGSYLYNNSLKPTVSYTGGSGVTEAATAYPVFAYNSASNNGNGLIASIAIGDPGQYTTAPTAASVSGGGATLNAPTYALNSLGGLTKIGTGTLTLSAVDTYTGATTIKAGTLLLSNSGSINNGASVEIGASSSAFATFDVTSQSYAMAAAQPFTFDVDPTGAGFAGLLNAHSLDITNGKVSFNPASTLNDPFYIIADYTSLSGGAFNSVTSLPSGYAINYNYLGNNDIALVQSATGTPEPSTLVLAVAGVAGLGLIVRRRWRTA